MPGDRRPPFAPGNELSLRHGARSPRVLEPVASALLEEVQGDTSLGYLQMPAYRATLANWARAQAAADLFGTWLFAKPIEEQIKPPRGGAKTPLDEWLSLVKTSTALADRLGLTPLARARLGRDVVAAEALAASTLDQIKARGRQSDSDGPGAS